MLSVDGGKGWKIHSIVRMKTEKKKGITTIIDLFNIFLQ